MYMSVNVDFLKGILSRKLSPVVPDYTEADGRPYKTAANVCKQKKGLYEMNNIQKCSQAEYFFLVIN